MAIVRRLSVNGAKVNANSTNRNWIPLHYAHTEGYLEIAWLLMDFGANVKIAAQGLSTPLDGVDSYYHVFGRDERTHRVEIIN